MLINSKFRDYYDNCAAYGVDTTVRYDRVEEKVRMRPYRGNSKIDEPSPKYKAVIDACGGWGRNLTGDFSDTFDRRDPYDTAVFGFCGVLHRVVMYEDRTPSGDSLKQCSSFFDNVVHRVAFDYTSMPPEWGGKFNNWRTQRTLFEDFTAPVSRENVEVFTTLGVPIFLVSDSMIITNPSLMGRGFQKFKDGRSEEHTSELQ